MSTNWDLWDTLMLSPMGEGVKSVDSFLGVPSSGARNKWSSESFTSGQRVAFIETVNSILSYSDFPIPINGEKFAQGSVIRIRTSSGDITESNNYVFVRWDDGVVRQIHRDHLRVSSERVKTSHVKRVSSLGDLSDFMKDGSDLVHRATKDIWTFKKDDGGYVIERVFDDTGAPLKGV